MAPKRKSDALEQNFLASGEAGQTENASSAVEDAPVAKKQRVVDGSGEASSSSKKGKEKTNPYSSWKDVKLEGEDEGEVPIYDDCNDVRRKIRALMKTPGWKVTQWLRDIGGINSNSYGRFMKDTGPTAGASNGTYPAAYIYFEKLRIFEGKKKSAKRLKMEDEHPDGMSLQDRRNVWVLTRR
ncbi:hypothetical protein HYDPIDRAFT_173059 [Hydnomerulius pinastri MD-312]|nr:hypothetical protein HYDPIDRAFT_173059 [Hydnomerulius pinastri MD-312]